MFRLKFAWKRKKEKRGGFDMIMKQWLYSLKAFPKFTNDFHIERAKKQILLPFLKESKYRFNIKLKIKRARDLLMFMQKRFVG